jgi:transposase
MPISPGTEVAREVAGRAGRYREVAHNLRVKEVTVGDGARQRRYVVCHNPEEEKRQHEHRQKVVQELEAELASMHYLDDDRHTKRACRLRASSRYGKYLRVTGTGKLQLDISRIRAAEKLDGKFIVHSNDETLAAEDLALGYKQLQRVEEAWRTLKSGLRLRPVFHWAPHRIHAHVHLTVLSLLLERVAEHACGDTWRNIRDDLKQVKLVQLSCPDGEVWQVTDPGNGAQNRLKSLHIKNPPAILKIT